MKNKVIAGVFGLFLSMSYVMEAFAQSPAAFTRNAAYLEVLSKMAWDGFVPATQNEKSRTLPEVYTDAAKFKQMQDSFMAESTKLAAATKSGNEQTVRAAWGDVNKTCAACHDAFRAR